MGKALLARHEEDARAERGGPATISRAFVLPRLEAPVLELVQQRCCREQQEVGERHGQVGDGSWAGPGLQGWEPVLGTPGDGSFLEQPGAGGGLWGGMVRAGNADGPHCLLIACVS